MGKIYVYYFYFGDVDLFMWLYVWVIEWLIDFVVMVKGVVVL